jgi:hypothetical protein
MKDMTLPSIEIIVCPLTFLHYRSVRENPQDRCDDPSCLRVALALLPFRLPSLIGFLARCPRMYPDLLVHCGLTLCIRSTKCFASLLNSSPIIFILSFHFSSRERFCPPSAKLRPEPGAPPAILSFAPLFRPAPTDDCVVSLFHQTIV